MHHVVRDDHQPNRKPSGATGVIACGFAFLPWMAVLRWGHEIFYPDHVARQTPAIDNEMSTSDEEQGWDRLAEEQEG